MPKLRQQFYDKTKIWKHLKLQAKLVIPEHSTVMASNSFFIAHGIPTNHLEKTTRTKSTLPHDVCKAPPDVLLSLKSSLLHYKQIHMEKTRQMGNHQFCQRKCKLLIISYLLLQRVWCRYNQRHVIFIRVLSYLTNITNQLSQGLLNKSATMKQRL